MSDGNGNLLFYTNGQTIWNQNHVPMANGTGLAGDVTSTQSSLIVRKPGTTNLYYVFTTAAGVSSVTVSMFAYSIVDMSLAAGLGSVTVKNATVQAMVAEKLAGTHHCNGTDYWITVHERLGNKYSSYLLTAAGLNTVAVVSPIGVWHSQIFVQYAGALKFSPNGRKMAAANSGKGTFELFNFNNTTGIISDSLCLVTNTSVSAYGVEFSPDGSKLYCSDWDSQPGAVLLQWDLCAGTNSAIAASTKTIAVRTSSYGLAGMQTGPDGKIYVARIFDSMIGVIDQPNLSGAACNYIPSAISIKPKTNWFSIPNFVSNIFKAPANSLSLTVQPVVNCSTAVNFSTTPLTPCAVDSYSFGHFQWDFGDPASGTANTSSLATPSHTYSANGTYTAKVVFHYSCGKDSLLQTIQINGLAPQLSVTGNFTMCPGESRVITATGAETYSWSGTSGGSTITLSPTETTTYTVTGTNTLYACSTQSVFTVNVLPAPTLSVAGNFTMCPGESRVITATGAETYSWSTSSAIPTITVSPTETTTYTVTGTNTLNSCSTQSVFTVSVLPAPTLSVAGSFTQCAADKRTYTVSGADTYSWSTGASTSTISVSVKQNTVFTVIGKDTSGLCSSQKAFTVSIIPCVGVEEAGENDGLLLRFYPNPVTDYLIVECDVETEIRIVDVLGRVVYDKKLSAGRETIYLAEIAEGIYSVHSEAQHYTKRQKLIKIR